MRVEGLKQGTPEWHAHRHGRLTGSLYAVAMGVSRFKSRQKLFREITGVEEASFTGNNATRHGQEHEAIARAAYEVQQGVLVEESGFHLHPNDRWLGFSPDGLLADDGFLEIKCPYGAGSPTLYGQIPDYYMPQVQGGLYVLGRSWCHFVCYAATDRPELEVWRVERDEAYLRQQLGLLRDFWVAVVRRQEPSAFKRGEKPKMPEVPYTLVYRGPAEL